MLIETLKNSLQKIVRMESDSNATSQNENCDFPSKMLNPGNGVVCCFVIKTGPDHVDFIVISRVPI